MDKQMEHTPTPYHVEHAQGINASDMVMIHVTAGFPGGKGTIAVGGLADDPEHEANAAFFIRACNNHDALVRRINLFVEAIDDEGEHEHDPDTCDVCYAVDEAKHWLELLDKQGETGANDLLLEAVELITDYNDDMSRKIFNGHMAPATKTALEDMRDNCQAWLDKAKGKGDGNPTR